MHKTDDSADVVRLMNASSEFFTSLATENILSTGTEDALGVRKKVGQST